MKNPFFRFADTVGDGSGTKNANGDYSGTVTDFKLSHPADAQVDCFISRMIVHIEDTANPSAAHYGNTGAALTNGIQILKLDADGATIQDITDDSTIKKNSQWGEYCFDVVLDSFGSGNDYVQVRWTFAKTGTPLRLGPGEQLAIRLNDDLTGLINHTFMLQGYYE